MVGRLLSASSTVAVLGLSAAQVSPPPASGTNVQVWQCSSAPDVLQAWTITAGGTPNDNIRLGGVNSVPLTGLTFNTLGYSNSTGGILNVWSLAPTTPWGQQWRFDEQTGQIISETNGLCAGSVNASGALPAGTAVVQVPCADVSTATWSYNKTTGQFVWGNNPALCLDAGTTASCSDAALAPLPYCNASLPVAERVADLISRLEPVEAASLLSTSNNGVPRLGIPCLTFGEALHGVLSGCGAPYTDPATGFTSTGCPTSFPTGLAMGGTFNRSLWAAVGGVIGREGRALFNQHRIANSMLFTPDINPLRDPRWGRGMEVPSEDPFTAGEYAAAYIAGLQGESGPYGNGYFQSVAMPKHFSAYDQEGNGGPHDRTNFCAPVAMGDLVSYHWPSFRAALQRGGAGGVMCSANGVNGYPSCAHGEWNNGMLRGQWGWNGAMVTDGNGVGYLYETYGHGALDCQDAATGPTNACQWGLRGGVDVELGETLNNYALAAVADGNITWADINNALGHTLPFVFRLGLVDPPAQVPYSGLGPADVDTAAARQLALEAAQQSIVLLRNDASIASPNGPGTAVLPLSLPKLAGKKIAVVGPNADAAWVMLANYHGTNTLAASHTPLRALQAAVAAAGGAVTIAYAVGCVDGTPCNSTAGFDAAVAAADGAAAVLFFGGLAPSGGGPQPGTQEGEEFDRTDLGMPGQQEALLRALAATGAPVVLVRLRGGPVALSDALYADNATLPAIVDAPYPGELGGDALAAVLLGDVSPSGRLACTVYASGFADTRSIIDYNMSSAEGVTYQYYTGAPQWPLGWGLSYTTWQLAWLSDAAAHQRVDAAAWLAGAAPPPAWGVNVTNVGAVTSDVSVLAFVSSAYPGAPLQQIFDFQRSAAVAPGETVTLLFSIPPELAAAVDAGTGEVAFPRGPRVRHAIRVGGSAGRGASQGDGSMNVLEGSFEVEGAAPGTSAGRLVVLPAPPARE